MQLKYSTSCHKCDCFKLGTRFSTLLVANTILLPVYIRGTKYNLLRVYFVPSSISSSPKFLHFFIAHTQKYFISCFLCGFSLLSNFPLLKTICTMTLYNKAYALTEFAFISCCRLTTSSNAAQMCGYIEKFCGHFCNCVLTFLCCAY